MAASKNDKLMKVGLATATNLDANYTAGATSLTVVSTSGMPTDTGITVAIDTIDSAGVQVPGSYNEYVCTVASATGLANVEWADGSGDTNYNAGATTRVYIPVTKTREDRIVEWGVAEHNQDGTHSAITATSLATNTISEGTAGTGVTIDGLLLKDNKLATNDSVVTANITDAAVTPAKWTNPYKFSVTGTSTSVSASAVIVKFSTEAYDSNSNYDPSTGLYTAPVAGFYEFTATIVVSTSNGGNNTGGFYAYKNGSNVRTLMSWAVGAISSNTGGTANFTLQLAANDTVAIWANNSIATSYGQGAFEGKLVTIN